MQSLRVKPSNARTVFGKLSLGLGAVAIVLALFALRSEIPSALGRGYVLNWLASVGAVRTQVPPLAEVRPVGWLSFDDGIGYLWLCRGAIGLAALAFAAFLMAERRREGSLYPSAGFICGACAVFLLHKTSGLAVLFTFGIGVLLWRKRSRR